TGGTGTGGVGGVPGGDCCATHGGKGCQVPTVEQCVCGLDPCCGHNQWDQICVSEAIFDCGGSCSAGPGGVMNTGGVPNTGGTGGLVGQCQMVFPDACGSCLCSGCLDQFTGCLGDIGCLSIMNCLETTGCSGIGCYQSNTCRGVIDFFGG